MTADAAVAHIRLENVRTHNLDDVTVEVPHGALTVVTGVSGSGKSSLAFDTLHAVAERRYFETLSSHGRRFLQRVPEPAVGRVERVSPSIALSQRVGSSDPRSTVGTLSGVHDLLRVVYAEATGREPRDFSFVTAGACPECNGSGSRDEVGRELLIADPAKTLRAGALVPTTKSGYIVYSQVTIDVLDDVCRAHGFDVDTPWQELTREQQDVVFFGSDRLEVPFGKHTLESRMRWEGIKAKPRELGHYKGLIPTIAETLKRNRNENALRFARSVPCPACDGCRLDERARTAAVDGLSFGALLTGELCDIADWAKRRGGALARRVDALLRLGLGYLPLARATPSLSGGEFQRVRLAAIVTTGMTGVLFVFDEPSVGLHATEERAVLELLAALRDEGNTVVVVEHSELAIAAADHVIQVGPGAGVHGGQIVAAGPPATVAPAEARAPMRERLAVEPDADALVVGGACARNLRDIDVSIPHGRLTVIAGVAGAGKSTFLHDVLADLVRRRLAGAPVGDAAPARAIHGVEHLRQVIEVDQSPIGRSPRSNPATYTGLFDVIRKLFAAEAVAKQRGFDASTFSFNSKAGGRCPECEGAGFEVVGLHGLPDVELTCAVCEGRRFRDDVLAVRCGAFASAPTILEVLDATIDTALGWVREAIDSGGDSKLKKALSILEALERVGLGYLTLGQRATSLSGGEAQRVRLAGEIAKTARSQRALFVLDEPTVGLHRDDVARLLLALDALVRAGHTVVVVEHDLAVLDSADHVIELGPEAGSRGGRLCAIGTADDIGRADTPTGRALRERAVRRNRSSTSVARVTGVARPTMLEGVATNNLAGFDVTFPAAAWTVVTGVSGSGKSSLVYDTLHGASRARFAEHLSRHARQQLGSSLSPWLVTTALGLRPTIALEQRTGGPAAADRRGTVATSAGLHPLLRTLWSRVVAGDDGRAVPAAAFSFFRREGACAGCGGAGTTLRCVPDRLIADPTKPLFLGALDRSLKSIRYYADENGRYHAIVRAIGARHGVDFDRPWNEVPEAARMLAMRGCGDEELDVVWDHAVAGEDGGDQPHRWTQTFDGLAGEIDREYARKVADGRGHTLESLLGPESCPVCDGDRLAEPGRSIAIGGLTLPALSRSTISEVLAQLDELVPADHPRRAVADVVLPELRRGLERLAGLGLGHLALDRATDSLSVGERQRLRLARQLAAPLYGVTYVLDEPSTGLHSKDTAVLIEALRDLVRSGNQVVTVEHDPDVVAAADHVIEIGPGAGAGGGRLVAAGPPAQLRREPDASRTGRVLAARTRLVPKGAETPARSSNGQLTVRGANLRYLDGLEVTIPLGAVTAVAGVSGCGKSTFVLEVLAASLRAGRPIGCAAIEGAEAIDRVVVDAGARAARSRRQCAAVLLGVLEPIRQVFAATAAARAQRWRATWFGWDSKTNGACKECGGLGRVATGFGGLDLLGGAALVPCEACGGRRFEAATLAVRAFSDLSIADVLAMSVDEFLAHLDRTESHAAITVPLATATRVGLGYLRLGQGADTLSGGEAQRLELATHLGAERSSSTLYVLDEPTRGLHPDDVARLQEVIDGLADRGHTVVVIEHDLAVIAAADHVIELGPGAGPDGGRVQFVGPPAELAAAGTATGAALALR